MSNRGDHVLANAEIGDGVLVGEGGLTNQSTFYALLKHLFEPHLPQGKRLVPREVNRCSIACGSRSHCVTECVRVLELEDGTSCPG
ncbi:hypothetical protein D3C87_1253610 [compost metagenome]